MRELIAIGAAVLGLAMLSRRAPAKFGEPYIAGPWDALIPAPGTPRQGVFSILTGKCIGTVIESPNGLVWETAGECPPGTADTFDNERHLHEVFQLE